MSRDYDKAGSLVSKHEGTIIEERNPSTGAVVRKYTKGKLLGKVRLSLFREDSPNVTS